MTYNKTNKLNISEKYPSQNKQYNCEEFFIMLLWKNFLYLQMQGQWQLEFPYGEPGPKPCATFIVSGELGHTKKF